MPDSETAVGERATRFKFPDSLLGFVEIVVVLSTVASFLTLFAKTSWVADICANLRIQWIFALLCGALLLSIGKRWKQAATCLLIAGLHLPVIFSGLGESPRAAAIDEKRNFTVATFNVLTSNQNYQAIEEQLLESDADVIAVLELSGGLERHLAERFAKQYAWSRTEVPVGGNFGIGLYSRHEWTSAKIFALNDERIPSIEANLTIHGRPVYVVATHTLPPVGAYGFRHRSKHLSQLAGRIKGRIADSIKAPEDDSPMVIVMGDLNLTPWSPHFAKFCNESGLIRKGGGISPTWYRFPLFPFGLVLDHVLASEGLSCVSHQVSPSAGSDHRMVTVGLTFGNESAKP